MATSTQEFTYRAKDRNGAIVTGTLEAESKDVVRDRLIAAGSIPLDITAPGTGLQREIKIGLPKRVKARDLAVMTRQFATMIDSGITVVRALSILSDQTENDELRRILKVVRADVESGRNLSYALAQHPSVFPPIMPSMVRASEEGGALDQTLTQIAESLEAEAKLRAKIKSALTYPVVVLVLAAIMLTIMLVFIVPVFTSIFTSLGGDLPAPTKMLVFLSNVLRTASPVLIIAVIAGVWAWRRYKHTDRVRSVVDPLKLRLPVFGDLFRKVIMSRFSRNFGTLLGAGVPILTALDIVGATTGSVVVERALDAVKNSVRQGQGIVNPLSEHSVFPPMVVQMMAVGEDSGSLDRMLGKVSDFYDAEVESTTEALTALIEPLMIAFLGIVVGGMVIALYLPMFKVFDLIK